MIIKNGKKLTQKDFKIEKDLQSFFEKNLDTIFNLTFIETEFSVGDFRIDTLAFDKTTKAFKIIEYKNIRNGSLVDQGYTYLKVLLDRKADFVLKLNEVLLATYRIPDIDWKESRVIFVSPVFTNYQINATEFSDMPFALYRVTRYEEDIIDIERIEKSSRVNASQIKSTEAQKVVEKEIIVYSEVDHLKSLPEPIQELYGELKSRILSLGDIDVEPKKHYIAFKGSTNICDIELQNRKIVLFINLKQGEYQTSDFIKDVSNTGHHGNGDYRIDIRTDEDIDLAIPIIRRSLTVNKK